MTPKDSTVTQSRVLAGTHRIPSGMAAWKLAGVALLLQIVLFWDVGALFVTDALVPGSIGLSDYPFADPAVMMLNRLLVVAVWALAVGVVAYWCWERGLLHRLFTWEYNSTVLTASLAAVALHVADNLVMSTVGSEDLFPRVLGEYAIFASTYGSPDGAIVFLTQLLYYLLETLVVVIMIALFQRAGEQQFDIPAVPWGGIGIALTWGALHLLTGGTFEMLVLPLGMGIVYLLGNKHVLPVVLVVVLAFFV